MKSHEQLNQETKTYNDQQPLLRQLWEEHDGNFGSFREFVEQQLASMVLWELVESDKPFRVWQRVRVEEDES